MSDAARKTPPPDLLERIEQQNGEILRLLAELVRQKRARARAGGKRGKSVAERAVAGLQYRPTEIQMAAARRALGRKR